MTVAHGWYPDEQHPGWSRWWDGEQWRDASWQTSQPDNTYLPDAPRFDVGSGRGWYSFDLVGENFREEAIARAVGGRPPRDQETEWFGLAELVPEPDNPHGGGQAISARVDGKVVTYFDQAQAREYFPVLGRMVTSGVVPVAPIRIWAVTRYSQARRQDELKSAVRLDLRGADQILPANAAPSAPQALIPQGRAVQVTGEADHLDAIAPHIGAAGMLVATLHPLEITKGKTTTTVLEVRLDDRRVGQLTPATSASLLPLVQEAERNRLGCIGQGLKIRCRAQPTRPKSLPTTGTPAATFLRLSGRTWRHEVNKASELFLENAMQHGTLDSLRRPSGRQPRGCASRPVTPASRAIRRPAKHAANSRAHLERNSQRERRLNTCRNALIHAQFQARSTATYRNRFGQTIANAPAIPLVHGSTEPESLPRAKHNPSCIWLARASRRS